MMKPVNSPNIEVVKEALEWKIFEIQCFMQSQDADLDTMEHAKIWFQPIHYDEVVEERSVSGLCGYPGCRNSLNNKQKNNGKYRIDPKTLKLFEVSQSRDYCCADCNEKSHIYRASLDASNPITRSCTKTLDLSKKKRNVSDVLQVIQKAPNPLDSVVNSSISSVEPPPFHNPNLSASGRFTSGSNMNGAESKKFADRRTLKMTVKERVIEKDNTIAPTPSTSAESKEDIAASMIRLKLKDAKEKIAKIEAKDSKEVKGQAVIDSFTEIANKYTHPSMIPTYHKTPESNNYHNIKNNNSTRGKKVSSENSDDHQWQWSSKSDEKSTVEKSEQDFAISIPSSSSSSSASASVSVSTSTSALESTSFAQEGIVESRNVENESSQPADQSTAVLSSKSSSFLSFTSSNLAHIVEDHEWGEIVGQENIVESETDPSSSGGHLSRHNFSFSWKDPSGSGYVGKKKLSSFRVNSDGSLKNQDSLVDPRDTEASRNFLSTSQPVKFRPSQVGQRQWSGVLPDVQEGPEDLEWSQSQDYEDMMDSDDLEKERKADFDRDRLQAMNMNDVIDEEDGL